MIYKCFLFYSSKKVLVIFMRFVRGVDVQNEFRRDANGFQMKISGKPLRTNIPLKFVWLLTEISCNFCRCHLQCHPETTLEPVGESGDGGAG